MSESKHTPARPPKARIDEILAQRGFGSGRMRYTEQRDYLQLCAEVDWCRIERADLLDAFNCIPLELMAYVGPPYKIELSREALEMMRAAISKAEGRS